MAGTSIKLFQFIQKYYRFVGIVKPESNQIRHSFNRINWLIIFCYGQTTVSTIAFLLFETKSVLDFGTCMYYLMSEFVSGSFYLIPIWKIGKLSNFIENCEAFIETSMYAQNTLDQAHTIFSLIFLYVYDIDRTARKDHLQTT